MGTSQSAWHSSGCSFRSVPRTEAPPDAATPPSCPPGGCRRRRQPGSRRAPGPGSTCARSTRKSICSSQPNCRRTWLAEGTVIAFQDWLRVSGQDSGPLFRHIRRGGHLVPGRDASLCSSRQLDRRVMQAPGGCTTRSSADARPPEGARSARRCRSATRSLPDAGGRQPLRLRARARLPQHVSPAGRAVALAPPASRDRFRRRGDRPGSSSCSQQPRR